MQNHHKDCVCFDCLVVLQDKDPVEHARRSDHFMEKIIDQMMNMIHDNHAMTNHCTKPLPEIILK